jgi:ribosome maturation protein Sdo1
MILNVTVDEQTIRVSVPEELIQEAEELYRKMDADMDKGWQMSRHWVESPDIYQRCQVAADKVLGALHQNNRNLMMLWSGYILSRMPGAGEVVVDTKGDITETVILGETS